MGVEQLMARMMAMDDAAWARHMNPLSGYTRFTILPLFTLALWSRTWIGWWALIPIAAFLLWNWLNPRAFAPPKNTDAWMTRGVLGERAWLNRHNVPIPPHHAAFAKWLTRLAGLGLPFYIWGVWTLQIWPAVLGIFIMVLFKLWFIDRMVWLWEDMAGATEEYRA